MSRLPDLAKIVQEIVHRGAFTTRAANEAGSISMSHVADGGDYARYAEMKNPWKIFPSSAVPGLEEGGYRGVNKPSSARSSQPLWRHAKEYEDAVQRHTRKGAADLMRDLIGW